MFQIPQTEHEWREIADAFGRTWNFPHCIGAIDGKHIEIRKPAGSGSYYYNYKGKFSIVLMAIVNANYEFLMIDVGANGRVFDGGVFGNTTFCRKLKDKSLCIPSPDSLPGFNHDMPYVLDGDDAFPLLDNLMKPYAQGSLTASRQIYNYRLSRARRVAENAFGILANRFRVLLSAIQVGPTKASKIVMACCYLHNYLRKKDNDECVLESVINNRTSNVHTSEGILTPDSHEAIPSPPYPTNAKSIRDNFCYYFNNAGSIQWQESMITK